MPASRLDLTDSMRMEQGATWELGIGWTDDDEVIRDLSSSWTAELVIADREGGIELTSVDQSSGIVLSDGSSGVNISITVSATKAALLTEKKCYYELRLTKLGAVTRLLQGCVEVSLMTEAP